jgi:hypothetical protein
VLVLVRADSKIGNQEKTMRSNKVFEALHTLQNRYMLCQLASKATRKFHKPNTRIQDTTNEVMNRIAGAERQDVMSEPENASEAQRKAA